MQLSDGLTGAASGVHNPVRFGDFALSRCHPRAPISLFPPLLEATVARVEKISSPKAARIFDVVVACERGAGFTVPPRHVARFLRSMRDGEVLWRQCSVR